MFFLHSSCIGSQLLGLLPIAMAVDGRRVNFCFGESLSHLKAPSKPEEILAEDRPPLHSSLDSSATARNAGVENDAFEARDVSGHSVTS